ncbi:hypothetical protein HOP52_19040 [Halomonas campisalis]|uniref:Uncharacterized protein n=1 Tax=Billgrantia campisalis TaxID=74661 RepID=A0ABS9PDJ4_9GAMM|nr:hypothetical protein [Halomonas campisalis]MCG6659843.1 hypothetical protein [Halomonas campisalis]MDR5865025.1 hypothetical protein [Halomonas campisalis]
MMIVELIDGDDFRDRLVALGLEVAAGASPEACAERAAAAYASGKLAGLPGLVDELVHRRDVVLPAVRDAIATQLLPALGR